MLRQALRETQTTRRQFSILTVLLENESVKEVLEVNKAQRHIRGGIATRKKYRGI